ncbi:MAG TPA: hypothetical protein VG986_10040 [Pseudolabrys sp.]|nr:hypothetical protein [Pseudolabrys sp.]
MASTRNHNVGAVYQRGLVHCAKCGSAIYLQRLQGLADEFSVRCTNCGHRGIYSRRAIVIVELPERRRKPRSR